MLARRSGPAEQAATKSRVSAPGYFGRPAGRDAGLTRSVGAPCLVLTDGVVVLVDIYDCPCLPDDGQPWFIEAEPVAGAPGQRLATGPAAVVSRYELLLDTSDGRA
jgi:hypothetical protein